MLVVLGVLVGLRTFVVAAFAIPSASMEPTLEPGDRVLVDKTAYRRGEIARGDVVVLDGTGSLGPGRDFVKRVVGLPGERVACCDDSGRLTVDGRALDEPYLFPGEPASEVRFDVRVPGQRLWVLGDHRSRSADSRFHLGDPGGGMVPLARVHGRVVAVVWPPGRARLAD